MIQIYTSYNCTSSKKVEKWLKDHGMLYNNKNILTAKITENDIQLMLKYAENGFEDIISSRSKVFIENEKTIRKFTTHEMIAFIIENPTVLKRPIVIDDATESLITGFNDIIIEELL